MRWRMSFHLGEEKVFGLGKMHYYDFDEFISEILLEDLGGMQNLN